MISLFLFTLDYIYLYLLIILSNIYESSQKKWGVHSKHDPNDVFFDLRQLQNLDLWRQQDRFAELEVTREPVPTAEDRGLPRRDWWNSNRTNGKITIFNGKITMFNGKMTIIAGVYPLVMTNIAMV